MASGNFSEYSAGLIDVSKIHLNFFICIQLDSEAILNEIIFIDEQFLGLTAYKAPVLKFAHGNAQIGLADTYLYTFDYKGEFTR